MTFNLRPWGEMNLAMISYHLSLYVGKQNYEKGMTIFLKVLEIIGYCVPAIFGKIPIKSFDHIFFMGATVVLIFCAIFIIFSNKGSIIQSNFSTYLYISSYNYYIN